MQDNGISYNNADSFAMIFDEAWKKAGFSNEDDLTIDQKINKIIEQNQEHPFVKSSPSEAISVAKFRLRLLELK